MHNGIIQKKVVTMTLIKMPFISKILFSWLLTITLFSNVQAQDGQWLDKLDLDEYKNKVVYIDFWASWCGPCRKSFPWINAMQEKYADKGLVIIGVNLDADVEQAHKFLEKTPAKFKLFSDPNGTLAEQYKLIGMPSSFVLDGNGEVRHRHVGFKKSSVNDYEKSIVSLLNELKTK